MEAAVTARSVRAQWLGGYRVDVAAGRFSLRVDEPETAGGTDTGPQPTDLFLASIASCFALALAHSARKRQLALEPFEVNVTGTYEGPSFRDIAVEVAWDVADEEAGRLVAAAERVCYVTNTLRRSPEIRIHTKRR
jgi:uncharacterized OsmC-like protein